MADSVLNLLPKVASQQSADEIYALGSSYLKQRVNLFYSDDINNSRINIKRIDVLLNRDKLLDHLSIFFLFLGPILIIYWLVMNGGKATGVKGKALRR
jgi:hypothetical protein